MNEEKELIWLCKENKITVSSCESLTGGLFCSTLASVPGASAVLKGGLVTYFTEMKQVLAHVESDLIHKYGVVSKECALQMAQKTREITNATYCVSFTGNAGPDVMEDKPAGCVYCAIASKHDAYVFHFQYEGLNRNDVRMQVVRDMIHNLADVMKKELL